MKKYKNKLFTTILALLAVVSFTSCDDYEWREGTMDYYKTITAAPNGVISENLPIDYNWVSVSGRYDRIDDIRYYGGYITVEPNGYIDRFTLSLSNSDVYLPVIVQNAVGGRLDGRQVDDFLNAIVEVVRRYGYATIYVDGLANSRVKFDLNFYIDIDAYVSY